MIKIIRSVALFIFLNSALASALEVSTDYFKTDPGTAIQFHVTDDSSTYGHFDDVLWAVSQQCTGQPDFIYVLNGQKLSTSIGGRLHSVEGAKVLTMFFAGVPTSNQGNFLKFFSLPNTFTDGDTWTGGWSCTCQVNLVGSVQVNGTSFDNCIDITYQATGSDYTLGTGHFILAKGIGLVQIRFVRTIDNSTVQFDHISHGTAASHTLAGRIFLNDRPFAGKVVQIHNRGYGIRSVTDGTGGFSLNAYGPEIVLRIGADQNGDDTLDFSGSWPRTYPLHNVAGDVYTIINFYEFMFTETPKGAQLNTGDTLTLQADFEGTEGTTVMQWTKNGEALPGETERVSCVRMRKKTTLAHIGFL